MSADQMKLRIKDIILSYQVYLFSALVILNGIFVAMIRWPSYLVFIPQIIGIYGCLNTLETLLYDKKIHKEGKEVEVTITGRSELLFYLHLSSLCITSVLLLGLVLQTKNFPHLSDQFNFLYTIVFNANLIIPWLYSNIAGWLNSHLTLDYRDQQERKSVSIYRIPSKKALIFILVSILICIGVFIANYIHSSRIYSGVSDWQSYTIFLPNLTSEAIIPPPAINVSIFFIVAMVVIPFWGDISNDNIIKELRKIPDEHIREMATQFSFLSPQIIAEAQQQLLKFKNKDEKGKIDTTIEEETTESDEKQFEMVDDGENLENIEKLDKIQKTENIEKD